MAKYDITKEASEDLYRIWEYTVDTWSEEQADTYYSLLVGGMNEIADAPKRIGKPYDEIYLFYILQNSGRALIVRILHEKMDYARHL